jgi:hypothetical protein
MPIRPFALFGLIACCAAAISPAAAQTPSEPATAPPAQQRDETVDHPMVFYEAYGDANACGPDCSEWIAAEGRIDRGAGNRLQRFLLQLNGVLPPVFLNSPGGSVLTAMEIGKLFHARNMTVSIGRTLPRGCDRDPTSANSCEAQISAGRPMEAELDPRPAMCNSSCVYALAGGAVRLIPPGTTLGIHDMDFDPAKTPAGRSAAAKDQIKELQYERLQVYLRVLGINDTLLNQAVAVPHTSIEALRRDDAARLGLDRREFGETLWQFVDKPRPAIRKVFFVHAGGAEPHYVDALVTLSCRPDAQYAFTFARELLPSDTPAPATQPPLRIHLNDTQLSLFRKENPKFYLRSTQLALTALDAVSDGATIVLPGTEFGRGDGATNDVTLTMRGFSAAYGKLQKACAPAASAAK